MIKGSFQEEDITIINIHANNIGAPKYIMKMSKKYVFIYLFRLLWVFIAAHGLSLVAVRGVLLFIVVCGLLIAVDFLVAEHGI